MRALVIPPGSTSHVLILTEKLVEVGVIRRGSFTMVEFRHDSWCPTMRTNSTMDCGCDVWAVVDGNTFTMSDLVKIAAERAAR